MLGQRDSRPSAVRLSLVLGGLARKGLPKGGKLLFALLQLLPGQPPVVAVAGNRRIEPDSLVIVSDGALVVSLRAVRVASVVVGLGMARIGPDRLAIVGDSAVVVPLGPVRVASVVVGLGLARIEPDRLAIVGDSAVVVPPGPPRVRLLVVGYGICSPLLVVSLGFEHSPLALGVLGCSLLVGILLGLELALPLGLQDCSLLLGLSLGPKHALKTL